MQSIAEWLEELGLGQYGQRSAENGVHFSVLCHLSDQSLKGLGILLGHWHKLQAAIAGLRGAAPAAPQTAKPLAERRQLTAMFSDLVSSTTHTTRLDPRICGRSLERTTDAVLRKPPTGGFVADYLPMPILRAQRAHKEDPERAVRAGLALVEVVAKLGQLCAR